MPGRGGSGQEGFLEDAEGGQASPEQTGRGIQSADQKPKPQILHLQRKPKLCREREREFTATHSLSSFSLLVCTSLLLNKLKGNQNTGGILYLQTENFP